MSLTGVVHLNADIRSEESEAEMAALSRLSSIVCNLSTEYKMVLPLVMKVLERVASVMVKAGDREG